jgi:predicted AlkP superfamily pyrophosphatase or phosphodiesterase
MYRLLSFAVAFAVAGVSAASAQSPSTRPHNVVLFVADGLRARMVDDATAPTVAALAREGVSLRNSHSLFPTFTTANASAMATGHVLGDIGDFSNTIYAGFGVASAHGSVTLALRCDIAHDSGRFQN